MSKMIFEQGPKTKKGSKSIGFYATLVLCICAMGVAGWSVFGEKEEAQGQEVNIPVQSEIATEQWDFSADDANAALTSSEETSSQSEEVSSKPAETNAEVVTSSQQEKKTDEKVEEQANTVVDEATIYEDDMGATQVDAKNTSTGVFTLPVTGKLLEKFSGDELVYNETLGDWRVHNGIDISAQKGTKVKTAAAGTVVDIYTDDLYATTVVIRHSNNVTIYYSGLGETVNVKKNDQISAGTVIGSVYGVPCENGIDCHIHLSVKKDGAFADPVEVMNLKF